jgi:hypothetical protein
MNKNINNYAMPELDNYIDNYFDFDAASSCAFWPNAHNNPAQQKQIVEDGEKIQIMPLTQSEIDVIIALRTAKAEQHHQSQSLAPPVVNNGFSGFQEADVYKVASRNDRTGGLIPTDVENFEDFDMPDYRVDPTNTFDGFESSEYPGIEAPAESLGPASEFVPVTVGQFK